MSKIYKHFLVFFSMVLAFTSCEKMLDVDTDRFVDADKFKFNSSAQGKHLMAGIFSQMQNIAERYVLFGELRGELMDITPNAGIYLQQINTFDFQPGNPYLNIRDFYSIINNCNYLISVADTSVIEGGEKILLREFAAAKAFRAWTYMQLALNYGKVKWLEKPIISIDSAFQVYPELDFNQIAAKLIPDLIPYKDIPNPVYGEISKINSNLFFIPIRFLLGELYLWTGQYEQAANEYRDLLFKNYLNSDYFENNWLVQNGEFLNFGNWRLGSNELVSVIRTTSENNKGSHLVDFATIEDYEGRYFIIPSSTSIKYWDSQLYYHSDPNYTIEGDLRGYRFSYSSYDYDIINGKLIRNGNYFIRKPLIFALTDNNVVYESILICTAAQIYLRYAEAVNRLGKPNLAFAVLKYGLKSTTLKDNIAIPVSEKPTPLPNYMDFTDVRFEDIPNNKINIGIHARGCGYVDKAAAYKIESQANLEDSVLYVEDLICTELALETAFNGNRFHDLMRIAKRRNDPSYLANKVADKYTANKEAIRAKLLSEDNWYLPKY